MEPLVGFSVSERNKQKNNRIGFFQLFDPKLHFMSFEALFVGELDPVKSVALIILKGYYVEL